MFEIYKKTIEINGSQYELRPLSGRFLPKIYRLMRNMKTKEGISEEQAGQEFLQSLTEQDFLDMHTVVVETFAKSYPSQDKAQLDEFVSQNLIPLFVAVAEVNLNNRPGGA